MDNSSGSQDLLTSITGTSIRLAFGMPLVQSCYSPLSVLDCKGTACPCQLRHSYDFGLFLLRVSKQRRLWKYRGLEVVLATELSDFLEEDWMCMGNCCIGGEEGADTDDGEVDRQTVSGQLQEQQRAWQVCQMHTFLCCPKGCMQSLRTGQTRLEQGRTDSVVRMLTGDAPHACCPCFATLSFAR